MTCLRSLVRNCALVAVKLAAMGVECFVIPRSERLAEKMFDACDAATLCVKAWGKKR